MTTIAEATDLLVSRLEKGAAGIINVLNGAVNDTVTTVTLTYDLAGAGVGSVLEVDDEQMYVVAVSTLDRTVIRGWGTSTAASHSDGAIIKVNPRFRRSDVIASMSEEIQSWPVELHRWDTVEVTVTAGEYLAELTPTVSGAEVHRLVESNILPTATADYAQRSRIDVRLIRDFDTDEYTSGFAIQLPHTFYVNRVVQCDLITSFDVSSLTTSSTDLQLDVGVRDSLLDILYYGVMWREMSTREVGRTDPAASAPLDAAEVPPTHILQAATALKQMRDTRLAEERTRMYDRWPILMSTA